MREVIVTGKTVEEATEAACAQLGLPREEVSIEILEMPVPSRQLSPRKSRLPPKRPPKKRKRLPSPSRRKPSSRWRLTATKNWRPPLPT